MGRFNRRVWAAAALVLSVGGMGSAEAEMETRGFQKAVFAAGCFWGVEKIFSQAEGVVSTEAGYAGGSVEHPTYEQVCSGTTGHAEAVEILFDPARISYEDLLLLFWQYHDPTTRDRQGPDVGSQYRSVIFAQNAEQERIAREHIRALDASGVLKRPIVTQVVPPSKFWPAEAYHQDYLKKNPKGYCSHHFQSERIEAVLRGRTKAA